MREVAKHNSVVGPNSMAILIEPPHRRRTISVHFFPYDPHTLQVRAGGAVGEYPVAFSPWAVGERAVVKPSLIAGIPIQIPIGVFEILIAGSASEFHTMRSQERPVFPSR